MIGLLTAVMLTVSMSDTVKEYSHWYPECPETVIEYMEEGKKHAEAIDLVYFEAFNRQSVKYTAVNEEVLNEAKLDIVEQDGITYYSQMELTAYIWTGNPCADGVYPQEGYTVACNDSALWHKWIYIEGHGTYYVHDTGGMASDVIDIYVGNMDDAIQFGRQYANVYIVE